jgi:hypothetical protein
MSSNGAVVCGVTASGASGSSPRLLSPGWAVSGGPIAIPPEGGVGILAEALWALANARAFRVCADSLPHSTIRQAGVIHQVILNAPAHIGLSQHAIDSNLGALLVSNCHLFPPTTLAPERRRRDRNIEWSPL